MGNWLSQRGVCKGSRISASCGHVESEQFHSIQINNTPVVDPIGRPERCGGQNIWGIAWHCKVGAKIKIGAEIGRSRILRIRKPGIKGSADIGVLCLITFKPEERKTRPF